MKWHVLTLLVIFLLVFETAPAYTQNEIAEAVTPLRLSLVDGSVSFWRPGAQDWTLARVNTPLLAGDELYSGLQTNYELQVGPKAFVRADGTTALGVSNTEPDFLQLKITNGELSVDVRELAAGHTIEIDTPNAAFTIERPGYYRVKVEENRTSLITRRGGSATASLEDTHMIAVNPSEELVISGMQTPSLQIYAAPELDRWDRWNYSRTDQLFDSMSVRYVPSGVYGTHDLDYYGSWRLVADYGPLWVPYGVTVGWAPYTTGRWIWDPFYGWTWVDDAPWGWAPFHYGRWVFVDGFWGWAPGPVITPVYAPALVGFFSFGPRCGWVALGWGEPLIPWWGRPGFIGVPWWGGWGGPHIVNKEIIKEKTVVNINTIVYQHTGVRNAVVAIDREQFGRERHQYTRVAVREAQGARPLGGELPVKPVAVSMAPGAGSAVRPPQPMQSRGIVATHAPHDFAHELGAVDVHVPAARSPQPRLVSPPPPRARGTLERQETGEKGAEQRWVHPPAGAGKERLPPPLPPRLSDWAHPQTQSRAERPTVPAAPPRPLATLPPRERMGQRQEPPHVLQPLGRPKTALPGVPAMQFRSMGHPGSRFR